MTSLSFPPAGRPSVSIVIPTHESWDWTSRTLDAVLAHTEPPYEVIVCDNASGGDMREQLAAVGNLRVLLNDTNVGFPAACNQGAAFACAPYVVFLNSDAMPHEGWLRPLLTWLETDDGVRAVGPRLLNLDGTLQEAGSTVLGDAMTIRHGAGEDADAPEYGFPRVVDYVSGACLATRRSTFHELGGFDAAFGLGYFEDVDLCFRLRSRGYRVAYEPASVITHAGGSSSDPDVRDALVAGNLGLVRERWKHELAGRPTLAEVGRLSPVTLRDLSASARVLLVEGGDSGRTAELASALAQDVEARLTALTGAECHLPRTVERVPVEDAATLLVERRFHFDLVVLEREALSRLGDGLGTTQPQAALVVDDETGALETALVDLGIET